MSENDEDPPTDDRRPDDRRATPDDETPTPEDLEEAADILETDTDEGSADLPPREVERIFSVLEEAVGEGSLDGRQFERLLTVLEGAVASPSETNPETVAELVSILEDVVVDPEDFEDVDGVLSVLEGALAETTVADQGDLEEVFSVIEEGLTDPTGLDPEDVERFRSGIEGAIVDLTDPASGSLGGLFQIAGLTGVDPEEVDDEEEAMDMFRIARIAAGMTQRATGYSMESGIRTGTRMAYAAANSESPADLLTETRAITLDELQRAGIDIGEEQTDWLEAHEDDIVERRPVTVESLRERGEKLLSQSAEVGRDETLHPAYTSILEDLAADEARILRLLATDGTQACMDVRDKRLVPFKSRLVAADLSMVASDAGCRHPERTAIYTQNLERLGLITFSDEPIDDLKRYQVLEAQPHIEAAREEAKRPKTVYGSVHLTDLGVDFCETCLPFEVTVERPGRRLRRESDG